MQPLNLLDADATDGVGRFSEICGLGPLSDADLGKCRRLHGGLFVGRSEGRRCSGRIDFLRKGKLIDIFKKDRHGTA